MARRSSDRFCLAGFTLIELVMVLVLIGIVSALGVGMMADRRGFSVFTARDGLIESALLAQQRALASTASSEAIRMQISQQADAWIVSVQPGLAPAPDLVHRRTLTREGALLRLDGVVLADGASLLVSFDGNGRTGVNRQWRVEGESSFDVCLASSGVAYPGTCQP